jgi:CheY-like chemotaxis protein
MSATSSVRVVVADDDPRFVVALTALLESEGLDVVDAAANGAEAVEVAKALRPSVVSMDIDMPILDGVEATRRIVALGIPVVVVSGSQASHRVADALAAGAAASVVKSAAMHELAPLLRAVASC